MATAVEAGIETAKVVNATGAKKALHVETKNPAIKAGFLCIKSFCNVPEQHARSCLPAQCGQSQQQQPQ
jgi:hypothetical protein